MNSPAPAMDPWAAAVDRRKGDAMSAPAKGTPARATSTRIVFSMSIKAWVQSKQSNCCLNWENDLRLVHEEWQRQFPAEYLWNSVPPSYNNGHLLSILLLAPSSDVIPLCSVMVDDCKNCHHQKKRSGTTSTWDVRPPFIKIHLISVLKYESDGAVPTTCAPSQTDKD